MGTRDVAGIARRVPSLLLSLLLAATLIAVTPAPADASRSTQLEQRLVQLINQSRAAHGLPALAVRSDLVDVAYRWTVNMANNGTLAHNPNYSSQICCWQRVGENVGRTSNLSSDTVESIAQRLHDAFMNSSGHRANILSPHFTEVGIGGELREDTAWVTQNFRQPKESGSNSGSTSGTSTEKNEETEKPAPKASSTPAPASSPDAKPASTPEPAPAPEPEPEEPALSPKELAALDAARDAALYVYTPHEVGLWVPDLDGDFTMSRAIARFVRSVIGAGHGPVTDAGEGSLLTGDAPAKPVLSAQSAAGGAASSLLLLSSLLVLRAGLTGRSGRRGS